MKLYGWDDTGPFRGELLAAEVRPSDLDFGLDALAAELGWDAAFTQFAKARSALLAAMKGLDIDDDLAETVRQLKASYVPIVADIREV